MPIPRLSLNRATEITLCNHFKTTNSKDADNSMFHLQQRHFTKKLKNIVENVLDAHSNSKHSANSEQVKLCGGCATTDMRGYSKQLAGKQEKQGAAKCCTAEAFYALFPQA